MYGCMCVLTSCLGGNIGTDTVSVNVANFCYNGRGIRKPVFTRLQFLTVIWRNSPTHLQLYELG